MLTFGRKTTNSLTVPEDDFQEAPLATQSLLLILVLVHHCTTQTNPYRLSLFSCANSQGTLIKIRSCKIVTIIFPSGNNPVAPTKAASVFKIDYQDLYVTLTKKAAGDATTLLLYLLVHRNQAFKTYSLNRVDLEQLVI